MNPTVRMNHPLATVEGTAFVVACLVHAGAMCPRCGKGTRATSKKWAKCRKCGARVERKEMTESKEE